MSLTHPSCHHRGFTLLELLVVIVIIGVLTSMVTLSVGDPAYEDLQKEAERLQVLINMAREETVFRSQEWVIEFREKGYRFTRLERVEKNGKPEEKLTPITQKIFRERSLPEQRLAIETEDGIVPITTTEPEKLTTNEDDDDKQDVIGMVWIFPSEEMSRFELTIAQENGEDNFVLSGTETGQLTLRSSREDE